VIIIRTLVTSLMLGYAQHRAVASPVAPQKTARNSDHEKPGHGPGNV